MNRCIVTRLREAAAALPAERISMQTLAKAHGPEAPGSLLLLMAAPCMLPVPGVGTVLGLGMAALAVTMWRGRGQVDLPLRVSELELPAHWAQRVLRLLASAYALAGRHARARMGHVAHLGGHPWMAATIGLMALLIALPIPFGNLLPALAVMLIGLGRIFHDGLAVLAGLSVAALAVLTTVGLGVLAWTWGHAGLAHWLGL